MTNPGLYIMAAIYIIAGVMHFIRPKMYLRIMPRYLPLPKTLVFISGVAEVILGIGLLLPSLKLISLYGIIAMLIAFLPVHWYMLTNKKASMGLPRWALILRIPLQLGLIFWAYSYM